MTKKRFASKRAVRSAPVKPQTAAPVKADPVARIKAGLPDPARPFFPPGRKFLDKKQLEVLKGNTQLEWAGLSDDHRMLCVLVHWYSHGMLMINEHNKYKEMQSDVAKMRLCLENMARHKEDVWTVLQLVVNPGHAGCLTPESRQLLHNCIYDVAYLSIVAPALHGLTLVKKISNAEALVQYDESCLGRKRLLAFIEQLEASRPATSSASLSNLMQLKKALANADQLCGELCNMLAREGCFAIPGADISSRDVVAVRDLDPSLEPAIITAEYSKLFINLLHNPDIFNADMCQNAIREWICHPQRSGQLPIILAEFVALNTQVPPAKGNIGHHTQEITSFGEYNKIVIFFFKLIKEASFTDQIAVLNQLVHIAWQYHPSCIQLIADNERTNIVASNFAWYKRNQTLYFQHFDLIAEDLIRLLNAIQQSQAIPGLIPACTNFYKENLIVQLDVALRTQYYSMLNDLYQNTPGTFERAQKRMQELLKIVENCRKSIVPSNHTRAAIHAIETSLRGLESLLDSPCLSLIRFLHQHEAHFVELLSADIDDHQYLQAADPDTVNQYRQLRQRVIAELQHKKTLSDFAGMINESFSDFLFSGFAGGLETRINTADVLLTIFSWCSSLINRTKTAEVLLGRYLDSYSGHIRNAEDAWTALMREKDLPRVNSLYTLLCKTPTSANLQLVTASLPDYQDDFQRPLFNQMFVSIVNGITGRTTQPDVLMIGKLLQFIAVFPQTQHLRSILFKSLIADILCTQTYASAEDEKRVCRNLNAVLDSMPDFVDCLIDNQTRPHILHSIFAASLKEAALWYHEGEIERAKAVFRAVAARAEDIKQPFNNAPMMKISEMVEDCGTTLKQTDSFAQLLAFLHNPFVPNTDITARLPAETDNLARFQNAWFALSVNAGKIQTREEAAAVADAWETAFNQHCDHPTTKALLLKGWRAHCKRFYQHLSLSISSHPKAETAAPEQAGSVKKRTREEAEQALKASRLLEKNTSRLEQKQHAGTKKTSVRVSGKKARRHLPAIADNPPTLAASSNVPFSRLPQNYSNPPQVQNILDTLSAAGYLAYLTGGYVRDTLIGLLPNDADIITNCPPEVLPTLLSNVAKNAHYPGVFHQSDGKLVVDIICREGSDIETLAAGFDFTVNTLMISTDRELLVPSADSLDHLDAKSLQTLVAFDASMSSDPSRILRLIRLSNQLNWPLDDATHAAIRRNAHKLCNISFFTFFKNIKKCFFGNQNLAWQNLRLFLDLDLLPFIFHANPGANVLPGKLHQLIENEFGPILDGDKKDQLVDLLALFAQSLPLNARQIRAQVNAWLQHVTPDSEKQKTTPLAAALPQRINAYYAKHSPLEGLSGSSREFTPFPLFSALFYSCNLSLVKDTGFPVLYDVLKTFRVRFLDHRYVGLSNLEEALKKNLLPLFFQSEQIAPVPATHAFIREHIECIFKAAEETQLIDMLALFALTLEKELPETLMIMEAWLFKLASAETAKTYIDELAPRIAHYYLLSAASKPVSSPRFFAPGPASSSAEAQQIQVSRPMGHLAMLSNEVLLKICSELSLDDLINLDKAFSHAAASRRVWNNPEHWKKMVIRHFPHVVLRFSMVKNIDWKDTFHQANEIEYRNLNPRAKRLFFLVKEGDLNALKQEELCHADMLVKDSNQESLKSWAVFTGNQAILDYAYQLALQEYPFDQSLVNVTKGDYVGRTILFWAIAYRQSINTITGLIRRGANPHMANNIGETALFLATSSNHIDAVAHFLSIRMDPNAVRSTDGASSLFIAADNGYLEIVKLLLDHGAHSNITLTDNGVTPLYIAAKKGHVEIVKVLLNSDVNPDGDPDVSGATPLCIAIQFGHVEVVKALLEKGANPNPHAKGKIIPLRLAIQNGHLDIVKALLNKGARLDIRINDNITLLNCAAYYNHPDIVEALLVNGADPDECTTRGTAPLYTAASNGHLTVVKILLENKANPDITRKDDGASPLFIAAQKGHIQIVDVLMQHSADSGLVVTQTAADLLEFASGYNPAIKQRMQAFINEQTRSGIDAAAITVTPWQIACILDQQPVLDCLRRHGVAPDRNQGHHRGDASSSFFATHSKDKAFLDLCFRGIEAPQAATIQSSSRAYP